MENKIDVYKEVFNLLDKLEPIEKAYIFINIAYSLTDYTDPILNNSDAKRIENMIQIDNNETVRSEFWDYIANKVRNKPKI